MSTESVNVGLVQVGDKFGEQYYLPYSIGTLQAYAQKQLKNPEDFSFLLPIYKRLKVKEALAELKNSDVVFFSAYVWNYSISLRIAQAIKKSNPDTIITFGGPQVPETDQALEYFLREHSFVDLACYGEGEVPFLKTLESFNSKDWSAVPSIGFIDEKDKFIKTCLLERIKDLDQIPSSYLEGVFDPLIAANPEQEWSALLETNRGCPYGCTYCYWGKQDRNKIYQFDTERVFKEIDWFSRNKIQFVFCCDANFGLFKRDLDIALKVSENKDKHGYPEAFSVQNTKNSTKDIFNLQKVLTKSGLQRGVNLALQSVNPATLSSVNRSNISIEVYKQLQQMFAKEKIPTFSDIITALPDESYDSFTDGVSEIIASSQHNRIQFINLSILENSEMADKSYQEKYGLVVKDTKSIAHHTSLDSTQDLQDIQRLVVATKTLPQNDWIKMRVFSWMISLLYFNKLLQIPFILLTKLSSVTPRELIEAFINQKDYPEIAKIVDFFTNKAKEIQEGGNEFVASRQWLNIWWPADEYMFIKLCQQSLDQFYSESEQLLTELVRNFELNFPPKLLAESLELNKSLIKLPNKVEDLEINCSYNIYELYQKALQEQKLLLKEGSFKYLVNRSKDKWVNLADWLREVVWYGTKRGAYLYDCKPLSLKKAAV